MVAETGYLLQCLLKIGVPVHTPWVLYAVEHCWLNQRPQFGNALKLFHSLPHYLSYSDLQRAALSKQTSGPGTGEVNGRSAWKPEYFPCSCWFSTLPLMIPKIFCQVKQAGGCCLLTTHMLLVQTLGPLGSFAVWGELLVASGI